MRRTRAFLAGATAAYLLDPAQGRRRRRQLRDRGARLLRRGRRMMRKRSRFALGSLPQGLLHGVSARARRLVARRRAEEGTPVT